MRRNITRVQDVQTPLSLEVHTTGAHVSVTGTDRPTGRVRVTFETHHDEYDTDRFSEELGAGIVFEGNKLTVTSPDERHGFWHRNHLEYEIEVPHDTRADVSCSNGPLEIADLSGPLEVNVSNGPLSVEQVRGEMELNVANGPARIRRGGGRLQASVSNGPLSLKDVAGPLRLEVTNGPIQLEDIREAVTARVTNGPMQFEGPLAGNLELSSLRGPIVLKLPAGSRFELDAEAERGVVHSDFNVAEGRSGPAGSYKLVLRSDWGDIRLQETAPARV